MQAVTIILGGAMILIGLLYLVTIAQRRVREKRDAETRRLAESEIATIVERSELTGWGAIWTVVFVIAAIVSFAGGTAATTVFQQIAAGVSWIGTLILFGLAFTTCRRRTYTIYRSGGGYDAP